MSDTSGGKFTVKVVLNKEAFEMGSANTVLIPGATEFYSNGDNELVVVDGEGIDIAIFARAEWLYAAALRDEQGNVE